MMGRLLTWFYCLPLSGVLCLAALCTLVFLLLKGIWGERHWWNAALGLALLGCAALIVYTTLGGRERGSPGQAELKLFHSYRAVMNGGNGEILRSNFMNAALFYPAGVLAVSLLPERWPRGCRWLLVLLVLAALSVGIEYRQYVCALGRAEVDDVFHNALGAVLGGLLGVGKIKPPAPGKNGA